MNILISNTLASLPHLLCAERPVLENKFYLLPPVGEGSDRPSHCHSVLNWTVWSSAPALR